MEPNSFAAVGSAAVAARDRLVAAAESPERTERSMAEIGATALFEEALLGAMRAHVADLRTVAR